MTSDGNIHQCFDQGSMMSIIDGGTNFERTILSEMLLHVHVQSSNLPLGHNDCGTV